MTVRIGSRYVARSVIGRGSFGSVFLADGPDGPVAVKLLRPDLANSPEVVHRFLRERSVLLQLQHPGIVPVRDLVAESGVLALVMDLVDGQDLRAYLDTCGALVPVAAARLASEIAGALSYAHAHGVVHRDLKPENILLRDGTTPLLTDFGIARLVGTAATMSGQSGSAEQQVLGTPAYLAPELASGETASPASDVYALGVVLYELVAGRPPYVADHPLSVVHAHITETPQRPSGIPDDVWRVVAACLAKQPAERPDADTVRVLLAEWADRGGDSGQRPPGDAWHGDQQRPAPGAAWPGDGTETRAVPTVAGQTTSVPTLAGKTTAVPVVGQRRAGTQVLPTVPGQVGRARISAPESAGPPPEETWQAPPARRNWLLDVGVLLVVAALFLAAGYLLGDLTSTAGTERDTGKSRTPAPSAEPKPRVRYLSELPFVQVANGWGPVELDTETGDQAPDDGEPMVLGGTTYERGLGVHAPSHVRVHPPEGCGQFKAVIGIDAASEGPGGGTVIFQVHVDGQVAYDSGVVTREAQPKPIQVEVAGAEAVDLIVADAGDGNTWDISDWADAQLVCD
ncbi:MAG: protein kinase domain-containing protein [Micromonosporaceae bacterium]